VKINPGDKVAMIGFGGHARVLLECLKLEEAELACVIVPSPSDDPISGVPQLTDHQFAERYGADDVLLANGVGSISDVSKRRAIFEDYKEKGYHFVSVVHPSAIVSPSCVILEGAQVLAGAVIQAGARIGRNSIVNTHASVDHDTVIGDHVHIAAGATVSGSVVVGEEVHIGAGAVVIQNVHIGRKTVVGAGGVVIRDLPSNITAVGVPAKELKIRGTR
jgi:sugar O-acyltransferase (sialic acid O-acetyltransferase NeuD family)